MYSATENIESTQFNGWINEDLLLKSSRRSTTSRKRNYELVNLDIEEPCDEQRRRVLRPRHNVEPQLTPDASRTRPIKSNRSRGRPTFIPSNNNDNNEISANEEPSTLLTNPILPSSSNNLPLFQALASQNWPQNYFVAHSDPSNIHRLPPPTYSPFNNLQQIRSFDPWVLHNYLLASSTYSAASNGHLSQESDQEDPLMNLPQMGYPSLMSENLNRNSFWRYPFLSPTFSQLQRPAEPPAATTAQAASSVSDPNSDLPYFMWHAYPAPRGAAPNPDRVHTALYPTDPSLSPFSGHPLPNLYNYGSLCPYHNINHTIQRAVPQSSHPLSNLSESVTQQNPFESFPHSSELSFGHYWHQVPPSLRPVSYPINSTNIDTLLHLAAHFEQRKRGITRDELDKLPTHRFKISSERAKRDKASSDNTKIAAGSEPQKCLVCLEDFESKQSIRTLRCHHEFHAKCIDKWLKINRTCPLCRSDAIDGTAQKDGS